MGACCARTRPNRTQSQAGGCDGGALGPEDLGGRAQAGRARLSPKKNSRLALSSVVATS